MDDHALLLEAWVRARSIARGLPQPVHDRGGLRVDTDLPNEARRWLFARPVEGLRALANEIDEPLHFLKLLGPTEEMTPWLSGRWRVNATNHFMTRDGETADPRPLPPGYHIDRSTEGPVTGVRIVDMTGGLAASGYAAERDGVFIYDRIVVAPGHRRRGLGHALMATLGSARRSPASRQVLAATDDGRALYETIGWRTIAPYTTATIPMDPD